MTAASLDFYSARMPPQRNYRCIVPVSVFTAKKSISARNSPVKLSVSKKSKKVFGWSALQALVKLGIANTRMKDFYDLEVLSRTHVVKFDFQALLSFDRLQARITSTKSRRFIQVAANDSFRVAVYYRPIL
jgi:hypothetical protein